jgi:protein tyrosine phosphatase (PTP) superfamily phosphohydrolase (DUF442 family)
MALTSSGCCPSCWFSRRSHPVVPPPAQAGRVMGSVPGIKGDVVAYNDFIFRGDAPAGTEGFASLREMGIRTVISVTPTDSERLLARTHHLDLVEIPFPAGAGLPDEAADRFLDAVRTARRPLYVHCATACRRAAALLALYRIRIDGWTHAEAVQEFVALGGNADRDRRLLESLKQ